jgi:type II secretory pathway pseudopilin PulG
MLTFGVKRRTVCVSLHRNVKKSLICNYKGFTIFEVMIVLVVNMSLFVAVVVFLGGRQARTEFTQSARDFESRLQTTANEVLNGYYQNDFQCTATEGNPASSPQINPLQSGETGTNKGCIFIGRVFTPRIDSLDTTVLVGRQFSTPGKPIESLDEAHAVHVNSITNSVYRLKFNMKIISISEFLNPAVAIGSFGFLSDVTGVTGGSGTTVKLYKIINTPILNGTDADYFAAMDNPANFQLLPGGIRICVEGGSGQRGQITIGTDESQTTTNVAIDAGGICG